MIRLSIVIVAYKYTECLGRCLDSIPVVPWLEVIVINNTHQNRGFGVGCNLGAEFCRGKHLLFLNPDCQVSVEALKELADELDADKTIGILGPQLEDVSHQAYLSCSKQPTRLSMPVVYSIVNRLFKRSQMVRSHWFGFVPPSEKTDVGIVSGAAVAMPRKVFDEVGGFDERFFLYWEEVDLARRVIVAGKRVVFDPRIRMIHEENCLQIKLMY